MVEGRRPGGGADRPRLAPARVATVHKSIGLPGHLSEDYRSLTIGLRHKVPEPDRHKVPEVRATKCPGISTIIHRRHKVPELPAQVVATVATIASATKCPNKASANSVG